MTHRGSAAFDAARRRYNAAHGIPDDGPRCTAVFPLPPGYACGNVPGHSGMHHAHAPFYVVSWADELGPITDA